MLETDNIIGRYMTFWISADIRISPTFLPIFILMCFSTAHSLYQIHL